MRDLFTAIRSHRQPTEQRRLPYCRAAHRFIFRYCKRITAFLYDSPYYASLLDSRIYPSRIRPFYPRHRLNQLRQSDARENRRHTPPQDETITLSSMWATEFYTPAHHDDLTHRLEGLGWTDDHSRNPVTWLKHREASKYSQSWMPLGPIIPTGLPNPYITPCLHATLPRHVAYAHGDLYCLTPSLVALVMEFVFDEHYSHVYDDALRTPRRTYVTPIDRGYRIHDPGNQRAANVKSIRKETAQSVAEWFARNIPGLYSTGLLEGVLPTCEFVTLRKAIPFPTKDEYEGSRLWYLSHLGLSQSFESWESQDVPDLRFLPSPRDRDAAKYHAIFSINEDRWAKLDRLNDCSSRESRIYWMHGKLSGMFGIWAIRVLLQGYAQHFAKLRNSEFLRSRRGKSTMNSLYRIGDNVSYSLDIAAVTDELVSAVHADYPLGFEIAAFVPRSDVPDYWWKGSFELLMHREIGENAEWLRSMDKTVRDHLTQYGTILGVVEGIHLQRMITRLAYAILALTLILALLTFITALEHFPWIMDLWESFRDQLQELGFFQQ